MNKNGGLIKPPPPKKKKKTGSISWCQRKWICRPSITWDDLSHHSTGRMSMRVNCHRPSAVCVNKTASTGLQYCHSTWLNSQTTNSVCPNYLRTVNIVRQEEWVYRPSILCVKKNRSTDRQYCESRRMGLQTVNIVRQGEWVYGPSILCVKKNRSTDRQYCVSKRIGLQTVNTVRQQGWIQRRKKIKEREKWKNLQTVNTMR